MTDKKFTQKEVIKALECCSEPAGKCCCEECPLHHRDDSCTTALIKQAVELVKRLKTRIVRYQLKNTNQRNALASLNKKVAEQRAEIERLSQPVFIMETNEMTDDEIKRLLTKPAMLTIKPSDNTIRTEAIKEFAERLKCRIREYIFISELEFQCEEVDNLVKEMTEGK